MIPDAEAHVWRADGWSRLGQADSSKRKRGGLFPVPAGAGGGVFEDDAAGDEVVTDGVGCGEITAGARRLALADQPLDLGDRHVDNVCEVLADKKAPWSAMCRADTISIDRWRKMKDAGCIGVKIGFGSSVAIFGPRQMLCFVRLGGTFGLNPDFYEFLPVPGPTAPLGPGLVPLEA